MECPGKLNIVEKEMERCSVEILGLAEHWWIGQGKFTTLEGSMVLYSGRDCGKRRGGVGFIIHKHITKYVLGYNPVNDRIITIRLKGKPLNITIVQIYAPTADSTEEEIEAFYATLQDTLDNISKKDIIMVAGDWNAKIGKINKKTENIGIYGLGERNERGDLLEDFCITNDLVVSNTTFQQHTRRLYTWKSPGDRHSNQIDYITIARRWRTTIKRVKTRPGADCGSDHQLLVAKVKIKLRYKEKKDIPIRYDMERISEKYKVEVKNKFSALFTMSEEEKKPDMLWKEAKKVIHEAARDNIAREKTV